MRKNRWHERDSDAKGVHAIWFVIDKVDLGDDASFEDQANCGSRNGGGVPDESRRLKR